MTVLDTMRANVADCEVRVTAAIAALDQAGRELQNAYVALRLAQDTLAAETAARASEARRTPMIQAAYRDLGEYAKGIAANIVGPSVMFGIDNSPEAQKHYNSIDEGLSGICSECGLPFADSVDVEEAHRDVVFTGGPKCWNGRGSAYNNTGCNTPGILKVKR